MSLCSEKPNYSNTLVKFYNEEEQFVKNLNFYDPKIYENLKDNKEISQKTSYKLFTRKKYSQNKLLKASASSRGNQSGACNSASIMSK